MKLISKPVGDAVAREFALTRSPMKTAEGTYRLPKARPSSRFVSIIVDGAPFTAPVTDNKSWSKSADKFLEYIWIQAPDGNAFYVTLGYGESVSDFKGVEFTTAEGSGPKPVVRVTEGDATAREAERVKKFKEAWATNRAAEEAAAKAKAEAAKAAAAEAAKTKEGETA
jgi:hypothetical protein